MKLKKVLFVATVVKKHIMVFHLPYLKWFKESGYEVHVCAKNDYDIKDECEIPFCDRYYDLPFERSPFKVNNIKVYSQLKEIIELNQYDIIHCHTPMGGVLTRLAAARSRHNGTRVIYTAHGFHFYKGAPIKNWMIYYTVERLLSNFTDTLITINKEDFESARKFKVKKLEYVPGVGIDVKEIGGSSINVENKRKELNISQNTTVILSVGELSRRKNHELIIKALGKIKSTNYLYLICGQGDLRSYLGKLAKDHKVNIKFLDFRKDVPEICAASDLFVFPSIQEGLPVALMEAMSTGLPVVCSDIRGNNDLIENGKGGYLVPHDDIDGFSKKIEALLKDAELRKDMGTYNIEKVKKYDKDAVMTTMESIYTN
ncbi:glycosyltransferase family 4 protein [Bacillus marinisedimentorum]|uniref:glycosyltransferase family 4 protein n=1 Tax=Bacillus marinisedimentorum TaxID=1821260 RepID=UPI000B12F8E9|nr:glycosyltransferase family 4 protein [Bacillus marinisedimentorum]